jgi:GNAT superfamily N-acetyltransferase
MSAATRVWGEVSVPLHTARLRHFASLGIGETFRRDGAFAVVTGAGSNIENGIVSDRGDVDPRVAEELVAWVRDRDKPASWGAETAVGDRLHATLVGLGCHEETTGVDMGARLVDLELPHRPPLGITIEEVRDREQLHLWADVADSAELFDEAENRREQERLYASVGLGPDRPIRHWLALRDGRAVGMATGFFHDGAALLEHIGVGPDERTAGIGTALVARWRGEARQLGCDVGVLGPTPDSQGFYERLGFTLTGVRPRHWYYLP